MLALSELRNKQKTLKTIDENQSKRTEKEKANCRAKYVWNWAKEKSTTESFH